MCNLSVRQVDLELVDVVERQAVAAQDMTVAAGLHVSADGDARALSMRNGHARAVELRRDIGQQRAGTDGGVLLAVRLADHDIVVEVHAEENGVHSAGRQPAILVAAAARLDLLAILHRIADRRTDIIRILARVGDHAGMHPSLRPLFVGIGTRCVLMTLRVVVRIARPVDLPAEIGYPHRV